MYESQRGKKPHAQVTLEKERKSILFQIKKAYLFNSDLADLTHSLS